MLLDGSAVDMATIVVGALGTTVRPFRRWKSGKPLVFVREKVIVDMLNGVTLVPFALMVGSVFSSELLKELMTSAKITIGISGAVGLFFVLGELLKGK